MELSRLHCQRYSSEDNVSLHEYPPQMNPYCEHLNKITLSTELAQAAKTPDQKIPKWCLDLEDVFSEKTHDHLPPHRPYCMIISLISRNHWFLRSLKYIPLTPRNKKLAKLLLTNILRQDRLSHPSLLKLLPSFLSLRKLASFTPTRTIDT